MGMRLNIPSLDPHGTSTLVSRAEPLSRKGEVVKHSRVHGSNEAASVSKDPEWLYGYGILCHQRGHARPPWESSKTQIGKSHARHGVMVEHSLSMVDLTGLPRGKLKWLMTRISNHSPGRSRPIGATGHVGRPETHSSRDTVCTT